jgi:hypothetical protein
VKRLLSLTVVVFALVAAACTSSSHAQADLTHLQTATKASAMNNACDQLRIVGDFVSWVGVTPGWATTSFALSTADALQDAALSFKEDQALLSGAGDTTNGDLVGTASRQTQAFSDDVEKLSASIGTHPFAAHYAALRKTVLAMRALPQPSGGSCGGVTPRPIPTALAAGAARSYGTN